MNICPWESYASEGKNGEKTAIYEEEKSTVWPRHRNSQIYLPASFTCLHISKEIDEEGLYNSDCHSQANAAAITPEETIYLTTPTFNYRLWYFLFYPS